MGRLRDHYMRQGKPLLAACCHLAVGEETQALATLLQGHEIELATMLCNLRGGIEGSEEVYKLAAMKLEGLRNYQAAQECLRRCKSAEAGEQLEQMAARRAIRDSEEATDVVYLSSGVPPMAELRAKTAELKGAAGAAKTLALVRVAVLAKQYELALDAGFSAMKEAVEANQEVAEARRIAKWLCCISLLDMPEPQRLLLMSYESYFASHDAMAWDFASVVSPLFNFARDRAGRLSASAFPVSIAQMIVQEAQYHAKNGPLPQKTMELVQSVIGGVVPAPDDVKQDAHSILSKGLESTEVRSRVRGVLPYGWVIPSAACRRAGVRSFITGQQIQGPEFWLNQLTPDAPAAAISLADAAQWTRCCSFSPTGDGQILLSP